MITFKKGSSNKKYPHHYIYGFVLSVVLLTLIYSCNIDPAGPENNNLNDETQALVYDAYEDYLEENPGFPGGLAIRVIHGDKIGFGHKGFDANFSESVHFRGQSTTKTFTAAGIVLLYQRGLLHFDSPVTDTIPGKNIPYLPNTEDYDIPFKDQITIRRLLNHTAGVYDLVNHSDGAAFLDSIFTQDPNYTVSIDMMSAYISEHQKSEFEPGASWTYSNSGYQLLAKIIERVSGKSYRQFMRDEFIDPLELNESDFPDTGNEQSLPEPGMESWAWLSGESINLTAQNMSANVGEGNIITSPRDLSRFYKLLLNGAAGIDMSYVSSYMMHCVPVSASSSSSYGMGLFHYLNLGYGHGGDGSGISVKCYSDPANDFTVFLMSNCWNFSAGPNDMGPLLEQDKFLHELLFQCKKRILGFYKE